ncbi:hypothetical protein M2418_002721 [Rhizobium sp. BIGb0125]|nr:hypothetical protein [Rhizobium sp. BIGb0125]
MHSQLTLPLSDNSNVYKTPVTSRRFCLFIILLIRDRVDFRAVVVEGFCYKSHIKYLFLCCFVLHFFELSQELFGGT